MVLDFDGVLTDGKVGVMSNGTEFVICDHRDGQGVESLKNSGVMVMVISRQTSEYVSVRCNKMKMRCIYGVLTNKARCLKEYLQSNFLKFSLAEVCFIGDDLGDLEVMGIVGVPIAVNNAVGEVKKIACYITKRCGGDGAVREVTDLILRARGGKRV